ncbi:MAG: threonylcarbamoyl-AMP synthase [Clostridiales bacterium]|nr:threonylcarbamoyl-AMP synthase [Candidatus Crickella caballi]
MQTRRLTTSEADIRSAGELIRSGRLVAFPTETVYGLGADATNAEAVKSIYAAKGRPSDNPMIVHIAEISGLSELVKGGYEAVPELALDAMKAFWPGPLTIILPKSDEVPSVTTGGLNTVAIRMPENETARRLIAAAGTPIAAPSANLSGKPSPTRDTDVLEDMDGRIDAVIMGEDCNVGIESTVVDMTGEVPTILRPGFITAEALGEALGTEVIYDESLFDKHELAEPSEGVSEGDFQPKSPGMKYKHYSPNASVKLIEGDNKKFEAVALELAKQALQEGRKAAILNYEEDARAAAHKLFADMRELDRQGYDLILIRAIDEVGLGFSVMNRMLKSAGYDVVE